MRRRPIVALVCACIVLLIPARATHADTGASVPSAADGKALFAAKCSACHQVSGLGSGPYPPLAGNAHVLSSDTANLISTVLNGRNGPIDVNGKSYSGAMPAWKDGLSSAEIASVLTYIRG